MLVLVPYPKLAPDDSMVSARLVWASLAAWSTECT